MRRGPSPSSLPGRGALWAVFLSRLPRSGDSPLSGRAFLGQLRALPYEGAAFHCTVRASGNLLCWKTDAMRPRDLEGLVERVANVPAFARSCAELGVLSGRACRLAAARFGSRFDPRASAFTAFKAVWRLGVAFLSLPWPLPRRSWQLLGPELLCLDWPKSQTAIIARREPAFSGGRLEWGRRLLRPLEEVGGAVQEYPLLAAARSLGRIQAILECAERLPVSIDLTPDHLPESLAM